MRPFPGKRGSWWRRCITNAGLVKRSAGFALLSISVAISGCSKPEREQASKRSERLEVTDGIVAAYDFDEGSGPTAADVSGTGNTGALSGPAWTSEGRRGSALSFDGIDDRVIVPDAASLDLTSGMTLMAWVKPAVDDIDWRTVVLKEREEEGLAYALYAMQPDGHPNAWVRIGGGNQSTFAHHHPPRTDRWTHLAATYDGSAFSFYVNGRLANSEAVSGPIETSDEALSIGGNAIWGEWFHGLIDEVRVYGRGLSQNEVELEMGGLSPGPAPVLVAAYALDEGSGDTTVDASGTANTGTLSGATWTTAGKHGGALSFDGFDDGVVVEDAPSLDLTYGMTMMAWVNPSSLADWRTVILKELETSGLAYALYAAEPAEPPAAYLAHDGATTSVAGSSTLPLDTWSHLAVSYDDVTMRLYVNGALAGTTDHDGDIETTDGVLSIGGNAIWGEWFEGRIDDVRVYNNGLTQAQIATDMNTPVGGAGGCGSGCDDGNACNGIETCVNGSCVAGTPVTCTALDQCHDAGTCNPSTGVCSNPPKANGAACNDANSCTQTDTCQSGTCTGSNPVVCSASDQCHDAGTCDPATGVCSNPEKPNGTACSDGNACTQTDTCQAGTCTGANPVVCTAQDQCHDVGTCNPATGVCSNPAKPNDSPCSDGNGCTQTDTCQAGTCTGANPVVCTAQDQCHDAGTCNPATGVCSNPAKPNGTACPDATVCNGSETCASGACVAGAPPETNDGNPCTTDACDPITGVSHTPVPSGTSCTDFDQCNGAETCDAAGVCQAGTPVPTEDGNACTTGSCDPLTGTVTQTPVPTGTECFIDVCTVAACNATGECTAAGSTVIDDGDPCTVEWCDPVLGPQVKQCSDIDRTVGTTLHESMKWIYEQPNPPQIGVAPGTIEVKRAAALRGIVKTRDGSVLPGVKVTILDHPEFGYTLTHADGYFDMVVNGGGDLMIDCERDGYMKVQRPLAADWGDHAVLPEIVMIPADPIASPIDMAAPPEEFQVAQGSTQSDDRGDRQGTLLVPAGAEATMHLDDGSTVDLASMNVRITEFTVGPNGPEAMPAPLPPENSYTYAFEVNADEAVAANAPSITFSTPLPYYVDNFLGFDAGTPVPVGSFDRERAAWVGEESGIVLDIVGESGGVAEIDVTGDGVADSGAALEAFQISEAELSKLAELHEPGASLWRVLISHFTAPFDLNWPIINEEERDPDPPPPEPDREPECSSGASGSIIDCEPQVLRETIPIAGTPYTLNYSSARVAGRTAAYRAKIPLTPTSIPGSLLKTEWSVSVAGRYFSGDRPVVSNDRTTFEWDGLDAFGRRVQGPQLARATITWWFLGCYFSTVDWAGPGTGQTLVCFDEGVRDHRSRFDFALGAFDARQAGLGGWTVDAQHHHSLSTGRLELGDGTRLDSPLLAPVLEEQETGQITNGPMVVASDGTLYISQRSLVWRIAKGQEPAIVAGGGIPGYGGDGLPATHPDVRMEASDIALGRDGSLYVAEADNHIVRQIGPDGIIRTIAGIPGVNNPNGLEGVAVATPLSFPRHVTVAPDGTLFVSTSSHVMRISTNGSMRREVGSEGATTTSGVFLPEDGALARDEAVLPGAVAVSPDGVLHAVLGACSTQVCVASAHIVKIVSGRIQHVAGAFNGCGNEVCAAPWRDGDLAKGAEIGAGSLTFDAEGGLYFSSVSPYFLSDLGFFATFYRVASITAAGHLETRVGADDPVLYLRQPHDGGPAIGVRAHPIKDVDFGPDGLYLSGGATQGGSGGTVFRVSPRLPYESGESFSIGARDADALYTFDHLGRHLRTRHSLTGADLLRLDHDGAGRLLRLTDESGKVTSIERSPSGAPEAIVGPFGQRTELEVDANGYLSRVTDPEGNQTSMSYSSGGLLTAFTNARNLTSTMEYDALGRLELDEDAAGGSHTLTRTETADGWIVDRTTALGRTTSYEAKFNPSRGWQQSVTSPDGSVIGSASGFDAIRGSRAPDGTITEAIQTPDTRFGLDASVSSLTTELPSGLTSTQSTSRTYNALNPDDLLDFFDRTDVTTRNGRNWVTRFERPTNTFTTTSPQGRQTFRIIDPQGRTMRTQVAGLLPVDLFYDSSGRLDHMTQGTRTVQNAYFPTGSAAGYLSTITDASGVPTTFTRDSLGRPLTETSSTATTSFSWDPLSNLASVTPPAKPVHEMTYTPVNLLQSYEPPAAGLPTSATGYTYDLDRMLRTETRPNGVSIVTTPDSAGRLDTVAIPGGLVDYDYVPSDAPSGAGKVSDIRGPYGVDLAFTYDGSLTTSTSWSGDVTGSVAWQYNNDFQKILETVSGATGSAQTAFAYDNDMLLTCASPTTCSPPGADALTLARHPQYGMVTNLALGETSETRSYNGFGELARQTATFDGAPLLDFVYDEAGFERDALGRIVRKTETILGVTKVYEYRYDALRRLDQVKVDGFVDEEFTYDANGNRLTAFKAGVGTVTATYDDQDRLLTYGTWTFAYTANGDLEAKTNTATSETWLFSHDALGNLLSVALPNGDLVQYLVDGMGRRVGKMKNGVLLKQWIYRDALKPVTELDGAGNWVSQFVYGSTTGAPDYVRRGNQTYRVVTDHLGSPKYVVNVANAGDAPFSVSYTSFGQVSGTGLDWMPFGFTGGIFDADTGLLRLGARDYDPVLGRWVNKDPVRFESGQVNHYVYVANDPLNAIDPEGKDRVSCGATMVGCVVVCAGAAAASPTPIIILGGAACIACLVAVPSACEPEKPKPPPCDPSVSCCR